ncbi:MAG: fatty acid hydroxylase [Ferrovum sp. 34-44-207]|nr:MAG: fatty acid hydroxylase [Ferrovum sp. 34-44-207]
MNAFVVKHELILRLSVFLGMLAVMVIWELLAPRRSLTQSKLVRWFNNFLLVLFNSFLLRLLFPAAAVGIAVWTNQQGFGLFHLVSIPLWLATALSFVLLDFVIYTQHRLFHAFPVLWRLHRVHHADLDIDVTTGLRFHPIEILLSMVIKGVTIVVIGAPVVGVVLFEVILNASSNIRISGFIDQFIRYVVVTPDMHRVHHSIEEEETNSNFGFNLTIWDRLFGSYHEQPRLGHLAMTIGISTFRAPKHCLWLSGMLFIPFIGRVTNYARNKDEVK